MENVEVLKVWNDIFFYLMVYCLMILNYKFFFGYFFSVIYGIV